MTASGLIDRAQILKAAGSIGLLGGGPRHAPQILASLCNPKATAREVGLLIRQEPALYARVLKVANSPLYGQARGISSLERALVLLGLDAVRGIAAAACLDRTLTRGTRQTLIDMHALMRHSLATAAAAEALARLHHPEPAADAFIAGLLHNLGILVQLHVDPLGVQAMIERRRAADASDMRVLEQEEAAIGHEECLSVIFDAWQLPAVLSAATRHHHRPMQAETPHRDLATLLHLGATMGLAMGRTFALEPSPHPHDPSAMDWLGIGDDEWKGVMEALPNRLAVLETALVD